MAARIAWALADAYSRTVYQEKAYDLIKSATFGFDNSMGGISPAYSVIFIQAARLARRNGLENEALRWEESSGQD